MSDSGRVMIDNPSVLYFSGPNWINGVFPNKCEFSMLSTTANTTSSRACSGQWSHSPTLVHIARRNYVSCSLWPREGAIGYLGDRSARGSGGPLLELPAELRILQLFVASFVKRLKAYLFNIYWLQPAAHFQFALGIIVRIIITFTIIRKCFTIVYRQGCALGLGRISLETSWDVAKSRLGLISEIFTNVSVSGLDVSVSTSRSRPFTQLFVKFYYSKKIVHCPFSAYRH